MSRFTDLFRHHRMVTSGFEERLDTTFRELTMFADAALMEVEAEALESARAREGAQWFLVGAAECLSERRGLDSDGFRALAAELVQRLGVSREQAKKDLLGYDKRTSHPFRDGALREGAETMVAWLEGKDNNAPLRLSQLLAAWGRA